MECLDAACACLRGVRFADACVVSVRRSGVRRDAVRAALHAAQLEPLGVRRPQLPRRRQHNAAAQGDASRGGAGERGGRGGAGQGRMGAGRGGAGERGGRGGAGGRAGGAGETGRAGEEGGGQELVWREGV